MFNVKLRMSQITILSVEKPGNIKEISVKSIDESELYKKAGFKTPEGFKCHVQWAIEDLNKKSYCIAVYGKTTGRATQENKFEFPPPIDTTLFFGNCIIVNKKGDKIVNLPAEEWDSIYEYLYGGFEDLGDDEDDEDEDEEDDDLPRTKSGYVKDDFVVDDDEEEESEEEESEEEEDDDDEEEEVYKKKSKAKSVKKPPAKAKKETKKKSAGQLLENVFSSFAAAAEEETYLDCTSELSEESYV